ncbi:MAG: hypothetical protein CO108_30130 [Deltaproteobacteria bacterium CG_4_9_14_3_um_filter_63_12]|nr:MAG: hypothetical protein CO108_30130 [Deltaproteobacteria bacterium CG_4_9_14_3_um_filter_63_12]
MKKDKTPVNTGLDDSPEAENSVLEKNLEALLNRAHDPPVLNDEAKQRIHARLQDHLSQVSTDHAQEPGTSDQVLEQEGTEMASKRRALSGARPSRAKRAPGSGHYGLLALAAAAALLLLFYVVRKPGPERKPDETMQAETQAPAEQPGTETVAERIDDDPVLALETVTLDDGTVLIIDKDSVLTQLGPRAIKVLRGRVLLDVAKGDQPFVVESPHGDVTVLGTRFLLTVDELETVASVLRGRVNLSNSFGNATLARGQQGSLTDNGRPTRRAAPRLSHLTSWARSENRTGKGPEVVRKGNLLARNPRWQEQEFPLQMRDLVVDVHLEDQVARVTFDQTFFNHTYQQLEGVYSFPLPADAAISRLAMYVDGQLMEGGIVERQRGRDVYESIVYQRRDPALLEWMNGNVFKVRIFPLPPRTEKRLLLSYTQNLDRLYDHYQLQVPISEVDQPVARARFDVRLVGGADFEVKSSSHDLETRIEGDDLRVSAVLNDSHLGTDLLLDIWEGGEAEAAQLAQSPAADGETFVLTRVRPEVVGEVDARPRRWVILDDTSASRDPQLLAAQAFVIDRFVDHVDEDDEVSVVTFDTLLNAWHTQPVKARDLDREDLSKFLDMAHQNATGSTDLASALTMAAELLGSGTAEDVEKMVFYVGDGMATGKVRAAADLIALLQGRASVVAVGLGDSVDGRLLQQLAGATGGLYSAMNPEEDLDWRTFDLVASLNTARVLELETSLLDAEGVPVESDGLYVSAESLAAGEELTVVAKVSRLPVAVRLNGSMNGTPWQQTLPLAGSAASEAGYLPRLWAQRRVEALLRESGDRSEEITALGMANFLLTPYTSLLVLENEKMYREFKLKRGTEQTWARYPAPEKIEAVYEAQTRPIWQIDGEVIVRRPLPLVQSYSPYDYRVTLDGLGAHGVGIGGGGFAIPDVTNMDSAGILSITTAPTSASVLQPTEHSAGPMARPMSTVPFDDSFDANDWKVERKQSDRAKRSRGEGRGYSAFDPYEDGVLGGLYGGGTLGTTYPSMYTSNTDSRLDDLTEFVPGFFTDAFDLWAESLMKRVPSRAGALSAAARAKIEASRAALVARDYVLEGAETVRLNADGHFEVVYRLETGLEERVTYDGESLFNAYPELGVATRRKVGSLESALLARWLPFVMPTASNLEAWYDGDMVGETLVLRPVDGGAGRVEFEFDGSSRIVTLRRVDGDSSSETQVRYDGDAIELSSDLQKPTRLEPSEPFVSMPFEASSWALVEMPLRPVSYWNEQLQSLTTGTSEWRVAERQLMASAAATQNPSAVAAAFQAIDSAFEVSEGELTLASQGNVYFSKEMLTRLRQELPESRVLSYLLASLQLRSNTRKPMTALAGSEPSLVNLLASYRDTLYELDYARNRPIEAARGIKRFAAAHPYPSFLFVLAYQFAARWQWNSPDAALQTWALLATFDEWSERAALETIRVLNSRGRYDEASEASEALFAKMSERGQTPSADYAYYQAYIYSSRGQAGWKRFWAQWQERAVTSGTSASIVGVFNMAMMCGLSADLDGFLLKLPLERLQDASLALPLASASASLGRADLAWTLVQPHLAGLSAADDQAHIGLLALASIVAERVGRNEEAVDTLERLLAALDGSVMTLAELRQSYSRLLRLRVNLVATRLAPAQRAEAVNLAIRTAHEWRGQDPDNAEIDRTIASMLYSLGDTERGWRELSNLIERHPADGFSYGEVASVLEQEGELGHASDLWETASQVEPTNPTWLLAWSNNLVTRGEVAAAAALLDRIAQGKWQDRFSNVLRQAQESKRRLK